MSLPLKAQACMIEDESQTHNTTLSVCSSAVRWSQIFQPVLMHQVLTLLCCLRISTKAGSAAAQQAYWAADAKKADRGKPSHS